MVERKHMSRMLQRRGHGVALIVSLLKLERSQTTDKRCLQKVGAQSEDFKGGVEVATRHRDAPINWKSMGEVRGHQRWESEKYKSWSLQAQGFQGHVATDGSLLGVAGKWSASGWSVVQSDYDGDLGPVYGVYGSMEAEFEVQRTIERAELTAFLRLLKKITGPTKVHVDNKRIIDGLWRGEMKCMGPTSGDA